MATLDKVVIKITGDTKSIEKTIDRLEKVGKVDRQNAASFKKTSKEQGKALDFIKGKALALGAALLGAFAIQQVVGGAIKILKEFEKELSTLQSITGSTTKEMEFFAKAAKDVGEATKTSSIEVVKAFTQIGSAQPELLKSSRALAEVTKQALILGKAAGIDATEAAIALTSAMNQFGVSAKDAARFTDIFATSQQKGSSFIRDTSEALINAGAAASAAGLSFETTNAAIQALAKGAIVGARAGTALRGVLSKLSSQTDDKINPSMIGLSDTLKELQSRNLTLADATKLVGEEGATGLLTLIKQIDLFEELDGNLNDVGNAMRQMEINTDNLDGSLDELSIAYENFVLSLSGSDGILKDTIDFFTTFITTITKGFESIEQIKAEVILKSLGEAAASDTDEFEGFVNRLKETGKETRTLTELSQAFLRIDKQRLEILRENSEANEDQIKILENRIKAIDSFVIIQEKAVELEKESTKSNKKSIGAFAQLSKQIAELKKELLNQAIAGDISKETVDKLNAALKSLEQAELRVKGAIMGTLPPMKAQKLELEEIKDIILDVDAALADMDQERTQKRLDAISQVSQAEQEAFDVLFQINTNKLIGIDNEEKAELKALEKQGLGEEELALKKLDIQTKFDEERAKVLTKQAQIAKAAALFDAGINLAVAVTKALAETANPVFAAVIAVLAGAQLAAIAAEPIPTFHEGKKSDLKAGEIYAKILESESVIPPDASKKYKGPIDAMIDKKFESYVFQEYMLPIMKSMGKGQHGTPYDDIHLYNNQRKQIRLTSETNALIRTMTKAMDSGNKRRSWR